MKKTPGNPDADVLYFLMRYSWPSSISFNFVLHRLERIKKRIEPIRKAEEDPAMIYKSVTVFEVSGIINPI